MITENLDTDLSYDSPKLNLDDLNFHQLWNEVKLGSVDHFQEIHSNLFPHLYNYSFFIFNNSRLINEIITDVFLEFWLKRKRVLARNVKAIIYKSLRTAIFSHIKDNSLHLWENFQSNYPLNEFNDAEYFNSNNLPIDKRLSLQKREILFLKCQCGLSVEEIGKILSQSPRLVRQNLTVAALILNASTTDSHLEEV